VKLAPTVPYVHQEYPKALYHATEPARLVQNAEEHAALGPAWSEAPGGAVAGPPASAPTDPSAAPADESATRVETEAKSLYATPAAAVVEKLQGCPTDMLEHVQALEAQNPRGARKTILDAIEKLLGATVKA
jgi:hypothetical protein